MKKSVAIALISLVWLCGCGENTLPIPTVVSLTATPSPVILPTSTATPTLENIHTPWPTLIYYLYPTMTPDPNRTLEPPQPTITAPPLRSRPIVLPDKLEIEEYPVTGKDVFTIEDLVLYRHPNKGGWHYFPHGGIINGKLFQAKEEPVNNHRGIRVTLDDEEITSIDCHNTTTFPAVITAWVYDQHWIIQGVCHQKFDVLWDGVSLNASKGYQSSFAFQVLGQYLFYLFKRNDQVWLSYNNQEVLLGYDEVKLTYCCMNYPPPMHYENLITFYAVKNDQLYYVAIGLFGE